MEQQVQRYMLGAAGAGLVLVWTTLGLTTAVLAVLGALAAANAQQLIGLAGSRRRRQTVRVRPLRAERDDELPLVPDEPSLVISVGGF